MREYRCPANLKSLIYKIISGIKYLHISLDYAHDDVNYSMF